MIVAKYALMMFVMTSSFKEEVKVIDTYEKPQECMAAYLNKEFKPKPDNVSYRCEELDADGKLIPRASYTGPTVVIRPAALGRQPDIVIEYRGLGY